MGADGGLTTGTDNRNHDLDAATDMDEVRTVFLAALVDKPVVAGRDRTFERDKLSLKIWDKRGANDGLIVL